MFLGAALIARIAAWNCTSHNDAIIMIVVIHNNRAMAILTTPQNTLLWKSIDQEAVVVYDQQGAKKLQVSMSFWGIEFYQGGLQHNSEQKNPTHTQKEVKVSKCKIPKFQTDANTLLIKNLLKCTKMDC